MPGAKSVASTCAPRRAAAKAKFPVPAATSSTLVAWSMRTSRAASSANGSVTCCENRSYGSATALHASARCSGGSVVDMADDMEDLAAYCYERVPDCGRRQRMLAVALLCARRRAGQIGARPAAQRRWTAQEVRQLIAESPLQPPR